MIRVLSRQEIDVKKWDACINESETGQIFGYAWYLDVCCKDWFGLVENDYQAVFPLCSRTKIGIKYIYQPFFTRHFGLYSVYSSTATDRIRFIDSIPSEYKYLDFCLHKTHLEAPEKATSKTRIYQELKLESDYATIRENYSENLNRNLRKAEKEGLSIQPDYNPETVVEQFRILLSEKNLGLGEGDYKTLRYLMKAATTNTATKCWASITEKGEVIAAAFFMESHNKIVYLKGFSTETGKKCGAMAFLFDRLIRSNAESNLTLDFGGSSVTSVARFFKSFGATDSLYLRLQLNRLPQIISWIKKR